MHNQGNVMTDAIAGAVTMTDIVHIQPASLEHIGSVKLQELELRRRMLLTYIQNQMREGQDYGVIPGTKDKTLFKPGAEKICTLFSFVAQLRIVQAIEDFDKPFFLYKARCSVLERKTGLPLVELEASANSREKKFKRELSVYENEATEEQKRTWTRRQKESRNGKKYVVYTTEDPNGPFDQIDNVLAIAQKRAFVRAVAIAANASEIFKTPAEFEPVAAERCDRTAVNDLIDYHMQRAGCTNQWGRTYLKSNYGKNSRQHLSDDELLEFSNYLMSLPDKAAAQSPRTGGDNPTTEDQEMIAYLNSQSTS